MMNYSQVVKFGVIWISTRPYRHFMNIFVSKVGVFVQHNDILSFFGDTSKSTRYIGAPMQIFLLRIIFRYSESYCNLKQDRCIFILWIFQLFQYIRSQIANLRNDNQHQNYNTSNNYDVICPVLNGIAKLRFMLATYGSSFD